MDKSNYSKVMCMIRRVSESTNLQEVMKLLDTHKWIVISIYCKDNQPIYVLGKIS